METRIVPGQPVDGICDTAKKEGFGPIVVGNQGMNAGGKRTLESVPDRVTHFAPTDLLVVRTVAVGVRDLRVGEGGLVMAGGRRFAVYRDEHGTVRALSPKCTHMGGTVVWNRRERTWDCPCHGSRFTPEGEVVEGACHEGAGAPGDRGVVAALRTGPPRARI
ncbi:MAG: Rieske 2Fe-2S domain-containing protein [Actinomycetota bacterium]